MSVHKNIEEKIYTPEQLEKLELLRKNRDLENGYRKHHIEAEGKRWIPTKGDKVSSYILTKNLETKRGIILKIRKGNKSDECDVQFGKIVFEGVPLMWIGHSPVEDIGKSTRDDWRGDFHLYMKIKDTYPKMSTKKLLGLLRQDRFSDEAVYIKRELATREHVPKKTERLKPEVKYIQWKDFFRDFLSKKKQ